MHATRIEYRYRLWLIVAILLLGFWAPWLSVNSSGRTTSLWLWLGFELSAFGLRATQGIVLVTALAIALAALGAALRIWASAVLGPETVFAAALTLPAEPIHSASDPGTPATTPCADGPYRFLRNPLYFGSSAMFLAVSILMPPSGALVALVALVVFQFRLILAEEDFLAHALGQSYLDYKRAVPRLFPRLISTLSVRPGHRHWFRAFLAELMPVGVLVSFAVFSWDYNSDTLKRALLISFGISLVARALTLPATASRPGSSADANQAH